MDHRSVAKDWKIEPSAVVGHHLRRNPSDLVYEGFDQFLFGSLTDVRRTDSLNLVPVRCSAGHQRADTDDRMVDQVGKIVPHRQETWLHSRDTRVHHQVG
jgi:hypothetical protein